MSRILIVGDGRPGHENQSIALAKHRGAEPMLLRVEERSGGRTLGRALRMAGRVGAGYRRLPEPPAGKFEAVAGAGSATYGAVLYYATRLGVPSVAMMLPPGPLRRRFDRIFAQSHDRPPRRSNIVEIPANFAYTEPRGIYRAAGPCVGVAIGGDNRSYTLRPDGLRAALDRIAILYAGYEIAVTTSVRTSPEIEELVASYGFGYTLIYRRDPVNPFPDFLAQCERVFVTADSTSMISEAVSYGEAFVEVLPLPGGGGSKYERFIDRLEAEGYLHRFDGTPGAARRKIDFGRYARKALG